MNTREEMAQLFDAVEAGRNIKENEIKSMENADLISSTVTDFDKKCEDIKDITEARTSNLDAELIQKSAKKVQTKRIKLKK